MNAEKTGAAMGGGSAGARGAGTGRGIRAAGLAGAVLLALAGGAAQAAGVSSLSLTCSQAAALVQKQGEVVIASSPTLYDRYVRDRSFCVYDEQLKPEWVPTRDTKECFVGYTCFDPYRGGGREP